MCAYFSIAAIGLFASEEDLSVIYVGASWAIVHDGHVWLDKRHTHTYL